MGGLWLDTRRGSIDALLIRLRGATERIWQSLLEHFDHVSSKEMNIRPNKVSMMQFISLSPIYAT
jgi:hypothetical protein